MNYQTVVCVHGNEIAPKLALDQLGARYMLANPQATKLGIRYVERDLNKSFKTKGHSYEEVQARQILTQLNPDLPVIDFHTMPVDSPPFVIITRMEMLPLAARTGIPRVVYMEYSPKSGHALIDHCRGISIEVGQHSQFEAVQVTKNVIKNLGKEHTFPITLFKVYGPIEKLTAQRNFQLFKSKSESYYPVLAGERLESFLGLKATKWSFS